MYSIPPYHQNKKFNQENLPESIFSMKPYYFGVSGGSGSSGDGLMDPMMEPLPSGTLPIPDGIINNADLLNDSDSRMALEDLLSRQLLLFCRLNNLERNLIQLNDIDIGLDLTKKTLQSIKSSSLEKQEDIVIHFNLDQPPLVLITFLKGIQKNFPEIKFLINYHLHSSLLSAEKNLKQLDLLKKQKLFESELLKINFQFNSIEDIHKRKDSNLILTFIGKKFSEHEDPSSCYASFKSNQPFIKNELEIIQKICLIISPEHQEQQPKNMEFWKLLLETTNLTSQKNLLENFGKYFIDLNENQFLLGEKQPGLFDLLIWCLTKKSSNQLIQNTLESLINLKWSKVLESLIL